ALGLHHAGRNQLADVARRGTGADYLVNQTFHRLEIAGRSGRRDLDAAWPEKQQRLTDRSGFGSYICVAEFEVPAGRVALVCGGGPAPPPASGAPASRTVRGRCSTNSSRPTPGTPTRFGRPSLPTGVV